MNWWRLGALVLCVVLAAAFWAAVFEHPAQGAEWEMPPARYAGALKLPMEVRYRPASTFALYCGREADRDWIGGCTVIANGRCYVTIREELPALDKIAVQAHERGHCNGWPRNHGP